MKNNKGFTLIEILAVIVILGILMIIAVPSVTQYITGSRNFSFSKTADKYIEIAMEEITGLEYNVSNEKYTYYIPTSCLETDGNTKETGYGKLLDSYVVVTFQDGKNDFYYTGRDDSNHGILLTYRGELDEDKVQTDITTIDTTIGVGNRSDVYIYAATCDKSRNRVEATYTIPYKTSLNSFE